MKESFEGLIAYILDHKLSLEEAKGVLEKRLIALALDRSNGNQCSAAKVLGIHRNTLKRKVAEFELAPPKVRRKPVRRAASVARKVKAG